jgi:3-oxoacyl-(acyl-carrier-protein) synthase
MSSQAEPAPGAAIQDPGGLAGIWPDGSAPAGLAQLARAQWPGTRGDELPPVAGFVTSAFSPLVAAVADLCLLDYFGAPPAGQAQGERTAIVLASSTGDLGTSAAVAAAVQAGKRVPPLLFYQSNHNAVAGYIAARWGLYGPVVCTMPGSAAGAGRSATALSLAMSEAAASAALLIEDGDADAALVIAANAYLDGGAEGTAMLIGPASWPLAASRPQTRIPQDSPAPASVH